MKVGLFLLFLIIGSAYFLMTYGESIAAGILLLEEPELEAPPLLVAAPPPPPPMGYNETPSIPIEDDGKNFNIFFHKDDKIHHHQLGVEAWIVRLEELGKGDFSDFTAGDVTPEWLVEHGEWHQADDQGYLFLEKEPGSLFLWAKSEWLTSEKRLISARSTGKDLIFVSLTVSVE